MTPDELRAFRAEHGLTRVQTADLLGVAPGTVRNWKQGVRRIPTTAEVLLERLHRDLARRRTRATRAAGAGGENGGE